MNQSGLTGEPSQWRDRQLEVAHARRWANYVRPLALLAAATAAALIVGVLVVAMPRLTIGAALAAAAFATLMSLPVRWLLPIAVVATLFVPTDFLPINPVLQVFPPGLLVVLVWLARAGRGFVLTPSALLAWAFLGWLALSQALSTSHSPASFVYATSMALPALCVVVAVDASKFGNMTRTLLYALPAVAALAIVEKFVLESNPLYGGFYASAFGGDIQDEFSTYRATSTLGFPIVAGTVFALGSVVALGALLTRQVRLWFGLAALVTFAIALLATVSRGPAVAAGLAAAGLVLAVLFRRQSEGVASIGRRGITVVAVAIVAVAVAVPVVTRSRSEEGSSSAQYRAQVIPYAQAAVAGQWHGVGPGQTEAYRDATGQPGLMRQAQGTRRAGLVQLENGYAQILVDLGYVGLILFVSLIVVAVVRGIRRPETAGVAAGLACIAIAAAGFNAFNVHPQLFVLFGFAILEMRRLDALRRVYPPSRPSSSS